MASTSASPPQSGNSVNVESQKNLLPQSDQPAHGDARTWDIFLSHSGAQKGFVKDLFRMLDPLYKVFFDQSPDSLPLGDRFPPRIFHAAKTCKLALVVLSNEFFSSKWPMLELSTFIDAKVKVLPLFYELSPRDLKDDNKLQEWHATWNHLASKDDRIEVSSWSSALKKLGSFNGLVFEKLEGELTFIDKIMFAIYEQVPLLVESSHNGIRGKDRLCKEFIHKFEELEQRPADDDCSKVCLLGVYGLSGSGKTTLCECLRDQFFRAFAGKAVHLNLPSNPTHADVVERAKQLFELTNFGHNKKEPLFLWKEPLSRLVKLPQVFSLLRANNIQNSRVFLVIDNITSQESIELVEDILQLGVGAGSRVMLVARSLDILRPLLNFPNDQLYDGHTHYVCGSMRVPSINEEEATAILMQPGGGLGLASNYMSIIEEKYSPQHKEIITRVTRMCAFANDSVRHRRHNLLYLPRALKIIGSQLRTNGMDLEKWERRLSQLDTMVKHWKEDAVRKIVDYSYENLHQNLKLIFLDVALFLVPYHRSRSLFGCCGYEEAVELLSFMHECNQETIKGQIKDLTRLCFLELSFSSVQILRVGDFFLEFANSLADASSMYRCRRPGIIVEEAQEVTLDLCRLGRTSNANLRSVILQMDERCERFDFPEGLSSVKAVVVRHCKSLAALGLVGLTSLVILSVEDCPKLRHVEFDPSHTYTLRSVKWAREDEPFQSRILQSLLHEKAGKATQVKQWIKRGWSSIWDLGGYGPQRPLNGLMSSASRLKALQVLRLHGTGITSLGDLSSYWPQLRVLEVVEDRLEEIELGNLPYLKQFFFGDEMNLSVFTNELSSHSCKRKRSTRARMSKKPKLLAGCPELEDLRICDPSCEDGMSALVIPSPKLRTLWLREISWGEPVLPDFASSAHSLEEIYVEDHWVLQRIDFTHQFTSLVRISLMNCPSLVKITGLECLPRLRDLEIWNCSELQAVENLEGLRMLERISLRRCPVLILNPRGLVSTLLFFGSTKCPNVQVATSDLETWADLWHLGCFNVFGKTLNLQNLGRLKELHLAWGICEGHAAKQVLLCGSSGVVSDAKCEHANENAQLQSTQYVPLFEVGESEPPDLSELKLRGVRDLICLQGVHRLLSLQDLKLRFLPQLTCLQGLECLTNLQYLMIKDCTAVERLPSLCTLVNMEYLSTRNCVNLKSLEGCDKMALLRRADFSGCKNLEHCPFVAAGSPQSNSRTAHLDFHGCKFASIEAMVGWVLDDEVSAEVRRASAKGLGWELTDHLLEKPKERMELAEKLVETLGVYFTRKLVPALTDDDIFDVQPWVESLKVAWRNTRVDEREPMKPSFHQMCGKIAHMMEKLGRVPLKRVLQQCTSDAQFRTSVARCLLETDSRVLRRWIMFSHHKI